MWRGHVDIFGAPAFPLITSCVLILHFKLNQAVLAFPFFFAILSYSVEFLEDILGLLKKKQAHFIKNYHPRGWIGQSYVVLWDMRWPPFRFLHRSPLALTSPSDTSGACESLSLGWVRLENSFPHTQRKPRSVSPCQNVKRKGKKKCPILRLCFLCCFIVSGCKDV